MEDYFSEILPTTSPSRSQRIRNQLEDINIISADKNITSTKDGIDSKNSFNIAGII